MHHILAQGLTILDTTQPTPMNISLSGPTGFTYTNIASVVNGSIKYIFAAAGIGLLLILIFGGFTLLTSAGDAKKLESGKNQITNGLIGFLIVFVAFWIVQLVAHIFGIYTLVAMFQ
jgi:hypothetical protein